MSGIAQQFHTKFKMFAGPFGSGPNVARLIKDVEEFAARAGVAAKSIGIEYLEHDKAVVLTLGYRDDETPYPIKLQAVSLGRAATLDPPELRRLEKRMEEEAARLPSIICHELFITEQDEFVVVFMRHQAE